MPHITISDTRFFYQSCGFSSPDYPALVLLHGSGGDSTVWQELIESFQDTRRVIAVDLPGHGRSQGSPPHSVEACADWLALMLRALESDPIALAGHSLGGCIAQQFARMYPDLLHSLILIGTGMCFDVPREYRRVLKHDFEAACMLSCRQAFASAVPSTLQERGLAMLRGNGPGVLASDLDLCATFDSTDWARSLTMPTLIICGTQDAITPCLLSQQLAERIPKSRLLCIDAAGHMVMQEQPGACTRAITEFPDTREEES